MTPRTVADACELSPVQQGMLFHTQLDPEAGLYVVQLWTPLSGALDADAFREAWGWAVERHGVLRTAFLSEGLSRPMQVGHHAAALPWTMLDWRGLSADEVEAHKEALLADDRARGFELAAAPLFRLTLIQLADDEHLLLWTLHHLILDGWSHTQVLREVLARYAALRGGAPFDPPAPRPYRDFVTWLRGRDAAAAEAFWRDALAGVREPTPLGIDTSSSGDTGFSDVRRTLSAELTRALRERARAQRVTLNTLFQGAWALVLSRYAGEDDVVFGATVAGRPESLAGVEGMVGPFINTLPVRVRVPDDMESGAWLADLQSRQVAAREHEHAALVDLQGWTEVPRGRPLFESILAFENFPRVEGASAGTGGLTVGRLGGISRTGYPLTLVVHPGDEVQIKAYADRARIGDAAAERLLGHLETVLRALAEAAAELRLGEIDPVTAEERAEVLAWGRNPTEPLPVASIADTFAAHARQAPDAPAVEFADGTLTYRALDARASQVARRLAALGVRPGDRVGLAAGQSAQMVAALLGILRAGAAVVPLDPEYPAERLTFMLADTAARVLVTRGGTPAGLTGAAISMLDLEFHAAAIDAEDADDPSIPVSPDAAAYVLYTSGSTGRPKGVVLPHAALVRTVVGSDHAAFGPGTRMAQTSNLSFDAAAWEIWGALLTGGTLVGIARDVLLSAEYGRELRTRRINTAFLTTQLFNRHVRETPDVLATLDTVCTGGEQVDAGAMRACVEAGPPRRMLHIYGPTECSVYATWIHVTAVAPVARTVPIGGPMAHTRLYVLDGRGRPVPAGVGGELHIGGERTAIGYLGRPALTAEKFVPNPFAGTPGARMYRTGDRVRWTDGGTIEFLARLDGQVKVRGFRIEPGEVEAALREHPSVSDACVIAREDVPGDRRLVAYVVGVDGEAPAAAAELRAHLARRLPEYMVPSAVVAMDALPLNRNGKVDRRALPAPESAMIEGEQVAPRDETEALLAALWGEVLGIGSVGVHDGFFAAGGHSLHAMQLATRVRESLRVDLPLRTLFEAQTVAELGARLRPDAATAARVERTARLALRVRAMDDAQVAERLREADAGAKAPTAAARRRALLDHLLRLEGATEAEGADGIVPRDPDAPAPLSFAQERLWVMEHLNPGGAAYTVPAGLRLSGALDVEALRRALEEVVRRHEALRTTFAEADGGAMQIVAPPSGLELPVEDLREIPEADREAALRAYATAEAARPFDLRAGPLLRARLVRLGAEEHALLLIAHHMVSDGWSLAVLYRELSALYPAFARGEASPLPSLAVQYADYAAWQRTHLGGERLDGELAWWRERLEGLPEALELPTDRKRPVTASHRGATVPVRIPRDLADALRELSRGEGATLFMTLLAGFTALLHRYAGAEDFAVGSPTAGRTRPETEGLIGFFVNTLVLRADLSSDPSFDELLRRVRETTLGAFAHQDVPFERLVDEVKPERSLGHHPLFQVFFALQNAGELKPRLDGLRVERLPIASHGARADLTMSLVEAEDGIEGLVEYATDLFDHGTIERMLEHFGVLLTAAAADPSLPVAALPMLPEAERRTLLEAWSGVEPAFPRTTVDRLFAEQAAATPNAVALEFGDARITYAELDAWANRLARHLRAAGVRPGTRVGLCLDRSPEMVVATLAIVKAGGAYVPLDPAYPAERLAFMLADTATPVLVTDSRLAAGLPADGLRTVLVDRDADAIAATSAEPLEAGTGPEAVAYVMYTSGSTGRPKGIEIPHRAITRLLRGMDFVSIEPSDVFLQLAPASFDPTTLEIWGPLTNGARLAIYPPEPPSVEELERAISRHGVTILWLTAGLFHVVVDERVRALRGVRQLMSGGDVLSVPHVRKVLAELPGTAMTNGYGPTENTLFTCCHRADSLAEDAASVPIGRPITNTRVYVLDGRMQPVPIGVPGELYTGGAGLAHGYLRRPALTAATFVPSPIGDSERLYRTGDRVRWLADGTVEFLGRVDAQVKIRGFRIEPGEVEAVLRGHPGVREAAVVVREDVPGERRLVAYVLGSVDDGALRALARQRLPEHMVPSAIVMMDALPMTPSGKVDRRALPAPESRGEDGGYVAPATETEALLAAVWAEVLGVESVGAGDAFFALGGNSLGAMRAAARIRDALGVEVPLRLFFEAPTVEALAARLTEKVEPGALERRARGVRLSRGADVHAGDTDAEAPMDAIIPFDRDGPAPLSFAQERLWLIEQLQPGAGAYTVATGLRIRGALDAEALGRALTEVVARHAPLRTRLVETNGNAAQVIDPPSEVPLPLLDLSEVPAEEREESLRGHASAEAARPFRLADEPPLRATLVRLAGDDHALLLAIHHTAVDGWSLSVLFRELDALYGAFRRGEASPLAALPIRYADYAAWQQRTLHGAALDRQLEWWRTQLAGLPEALHLPTDRPRPAVRSQHGGTLRITLPRALVDALHGLAQREGATLFMALLAGFQALLHRYTGDDDFAVGTPVAGRTRPETEALVGLFVNTLVVRADLSGDPDVRTLLARVRDAALGAWAHQDVPFERLVDAVASGRSLGHNPLFQVMFALQNAGDLRPRLDGLSVERFGVHGGGALFDLTWSLVETEDGIEGLVEYAADLFDAATVARMADHFRALLEAAAADPATRVSALPMGSAADTLQARDTRVCVLDAAMRPVPVGVAGQLYSADTGLVHGYPGQPARTAEAFVPNPFGNGERLYATGDRVRWRADATLEFLGRMDAQGTARAVRVEPVAVAPVAKHTEERGEEQPAAYTAPRTETETLLADVWAEVLGLARVGIDDPFWEIGGHSLRAMRAAARIRDALRVDVPMRLFFEAPTVAALAARLAQDEAAPGTLERIAKVARLVRRMPEADVDRLLAEADSLDLDAAADARRQSLLDLLLRREGTAADGADARIRPRDPNIPAPLSFAQERLWVMDQLQPGSAAYTISAGLRLRGTLDVDALRRAFAEIIRRHEALRTTFPTVDGAPVQAVMPAGEIEIPLRDLSSSSHEREDALRAFAADEAARPFDLSKDSLVRIRLVRMVDDEHVLLIYLHHAVSDGWSMAVMYRELNALYAAFTRGEPSPLAPLAVQYADYAAWQRAYLAGPAGARQLAWWSARLAGLPEVLELPADRPRPPVARYRGALTRAELSPALTDALNELSRREGTTLFMTLLAGFAALLHRYTGEADVAVGTPVAGRTRPEAEALIGDFVNTLVLRTDLSGAPTFRALLGRVREATLGAYAHQDLPFERLVDELRPERSLSHAPLFQVLFGLQNAGDMRPKLDGIDVEGLAVHGGTTRYDLAWSLVERDCGVQAMVEYDTDLFDAGTVDRMLAHFQSLLAAASADPSARIADLPMLSADEREAALSASNDTAAPYAAIPIHRLVFAQAARTPDAIAVRGGAQTLTYAELDAASGRLAHHLIGLGVHRGERLAISMERSPDLLVAMLATWKAGAAYVPIDPAYPEDRRAHMLADSGASVILTDAASADGLPASGGQIVTVDAVDLSGVDASAPAIPVDADDVAYVIYTSGSTGRPKGVMVPHGGVANFLASMAKEPGIAADDVLVAVTSLSFDIAVLELLLPLTAGAQVVVATREEATDAARLAALLDASGATVMQATPATWRALVQSGWAGRSQLAVLCGGEALAPDLARELLPRGRALWNLYGPTETTIWSAAQRVEDAERITLGRPIANTRLYVLDPAGQPCPAGVPGELYIGGDGVVRGYLHRPGLTAERFVPDVFAASPGARMYRTGDRVRRKADGALEFLGRMDFQVKVRGFRIELGEIEAALAEHPAVRECVAVVREDAGDARIVAYIVPNDAVPAADALRESLARRLPDYMLPSAYVTLDALPLTPNGKVDRRALPAPEWSAGSGYVAPRDATEEALAALWAEVLDVDRVGVHDDFFARGGHSLRGTQLVTRIRAVFGVEVPLRALFEAPTVAGLARRVEQARGQETVLGADPVLPVPRDGRPLPLSFAQLRLWFLEQLEPDNARYNMAASLGLSGALDADVLRRALQAIVNRHESLRTTYGSDAGQPVQVIHPHVDFPLPLIDLTHLPAAEREPALARMGADEVDRPINLATGPVMRGHLYRLDDGEHVLLLVMHHVVTDGWSMGVMLRELRALYAAFLDGRPSPLAPLAVQYADYAAWQHGFLRGETLERQLGYWKDKLAGAPTVLELPSDRPRPAVQRYRGSHRTQFLEPELARQLEALARREGSTLYMVLLAAFYTLLYRYTGQRDLLVGTPVANRMRPEVEELIGFFVNTLVLRTDLSGDPTFRELVARVRETALGAYAHQDVPFERLVEELGVPRDMSHEPLFQVMFVLQNAAMGDVDLPGVTLHQRAMDRRTTKFDFTVFMWADADGLRGWWEYNTDLWDGETVDRLLGHYHTLLRALAADPDAKIGTLPLLTAPERAQVLDTWNDTAAPEPEAACVHHLVEAQVRRTPDETAVVYEGERLTYAQLNARANQLAHHLIGLGVGPDRPVGICLERSLEMTVALLAILKAGGAVVAIDPTYPEERIAFMVRDAGLAALLTQEKLAASMPSAGTRVVLLDRGAAQFAHHSAEDPRVAVDARNLMYCIYTSGSTGIPKGVGVPHREFLNLLQWQWDGSGLARKAKTVQFSTFGFCVSFQECFGTWAAGSTLVVIPESRRRDLEALMEVLRQERVERLYVPFAALKHLSEIEWAEDRLATTLREVVTAGEPLQVTQAMRAFFRRLGAVLHNQYGSSETHVVTALPLAGDPDGWPVRAPVGRPISNARIYLLDGHLHPVPIGVPGEVCVGGEACLPRGYLGDPALTAAKLVPDPFSPVPGARMYRSGDVARHHHDGTVEVTGRLDFQIKIRGFRVEIGEVEAAIRRIAAVRDVAVVAGDNRFGEKRLIAYPVFRDGPVPAHVLVDELKRRLPEYMIPTAWVPVDRLPVNANGKLDAAALPAPEEADAEGAEAYVAPRTATETALAEIWGEVLGKGGIGVRDNFFAVGGHSLLATQVMARVRDRCRADLPLRALFDNATIETLARAVDAAARTDAPAEERVARRSRVVRAVHIAPVPGEETAALVPAGGEPLAVGDD